MLEENVQATGPDEPGNQPETAVDDKQKAGEYLAAWQRCQADYINLKRRTDVEKEEAGKSANAALLLALLPAIDDLERAFAAVPSDIDKNNWVSGMRLIWKKLQSALETQGLTTVRCVGESFDPCLHEAVRRCSGTEGMVIAELEKGYKFRDKVIRPPKVAVGEGEEEFKEE